MTPNQAQLARDLIVMSATATGYAIWARAVYRSLVRLWHRETTVAELLGLDDREGL